MRSRKIESHPLDNARFPATLALSMPPPSPRGLAGFRLLAEFVALVQALAPRVAQATPKEAFSEHPLFWIAGDAASRGIPPRILEFVLDNPQISVGFKNYDGQKSAGYAPDDDTLYLAKEARDATGRADPSKVKTPANLAQDAFHEAFHAYWDLKEFEKRKVYWVMELAKFAQKEYAKKKKVIDVEKDGQEVVEENIGVRFGNVIGYLVADSIQAIRVAEKALVSAAQGSSADDGPPRDPHEAAERWLGLMETHAETEIFGPAQAYCGRYEETNISFPVLPEDASEELRRAASMMQGFIVYQLLLGKPFPQDFLGRDLAGMEEAIKRDLRLFTGRVQERTRGKIRMLVEAHNRSKRLSSVSQDVERVVGPQ